MACTIAKCVQKGIPQKKEINKESATSMRMKEEIYLFEIYRPKSHSCVRKRKDARQFGFSSQIGCENMGKPCMYKNESYRLHTFSIPNHQLAASEYVYGIGTHEKNDSTLQIPKATPPWHFVSPHCFSMRWTP